VGTEAVSEGLDYYYDKTKQFVRLESDRPIVLLHRKTQVDETVFFLLFCCFQPLFF
jgi:hypothetical protein